MSLNRGFADAALGYALVRGRRPAAGSGPDDGGGPAADEPTSPQPTPDKPREQVSV